MKPPQAITARSYRFTAVVLSFAAFAALLMASPLGRLERSWGLEGLYALRGARQVPPGVMVIAINKGAANALGLPDRPDRWPRALHAELLTRLHEHGARVVAFDLLFDRPREAADDAQLAGALQATQKGVLVAYLRREMQTAGPLVVATDQVVQPLPSLAQAALATAPFALVKSSEGVLSYLSFAPQFDDNPSLPLVLSAWCEPQAIAPLAKAAGVAVSSASPHHLVTALRRAALAQAAAFGVGAPGEADGVARWRRQLVDPGSEVFFNLYGPPGHLQTMPYDQALAALREGGRSADRFKGMAVLVGALEFNQPEQRDVYRTPWSTPDGLDISGVELGATALANQLDGSALGTLPGGWPSLWLAGWAALMMLPWRLRAMRWALPLSTLVALGYCLMASAVFSQWHGWLPWALPLYVVWPSSVLLGLGLRLREVERQRQRLRGALDRYGPRDEIARLARELSDADESVFVACLSTDIEDFTSRIEGQEPAQARRWLNAYFEKVFPIVRAHGGHVMDHAGDAMVCIWLSGKDAQAACRAAVAAARDLHAALNITQTPDASDPQAFPTRLGLHFGPVALGEVGDARHAEQRVVGDIVNTASRIQSANKALGTRMLVSDVVASHLPEHECRALGRFLLAGKRLVVGLADPAPAPPGLWTDHAQALRAWETGDLPSARQALARLLSQWPADGPAKFLLSRIDQTTAPKDGTGVGPHVGDPGVIPLPLK